MIERKIQTEVLADAALKIINALVQNHGITIPDIVRIANVHISEDAVRKYIQRANTHRHKRHSVALEAIIKYIKIRKEFIIKKEPTLFYRYKDIIFSDMNTEEYRKITINSYKYIYKVLRISDTDNRCKMEVMLGRHILYRKTTNNMVSKSIVVIKRINEERGRQSIYEYIHEKMTVNGKSTISDGIAFSLAENIYLFGDINDGSQIEIIIIKNKPIKGGVRMGFVTTSCDYDSESTICTAAIMHECDKDSVCPEIINAEKVGDEEILKYIDRCIIDL